MCFVRRLMQDVDAGNGKINKIRADVNAEISCV